jgi:hypothetical protein
MTLQYVMVKEEKLQQYRILYYIFHIYPEYYNAMNSLKPGKKNYAPEVKAILLTDSIF